MRVTENSTMNTVRDSLNRSRSRMSDLQKQNATLKRVNAPSDDPVGNSRLMTIRNESLDNEQYEKNANFAKTFLNYTDSSLDELTQLVVRAKELALQSANSAAQGSESRVMISQEVRNLLDQVQTIANRRLTDRFIFSGYKTNSEPFDKQGNYYGDEGNIMVEVQKDTFVGMNLPGRELFLGKEAKIAPLRAPAGEGEAENDLAQAQNPSSDDLFRTMDALRVGLMTNNIDLLRSTIDPLDQIRDRIITTRAQVGARVRGIDNALEQMGRANVFNAELTSSIEDADVIQVVSDIAKEETVLRASLGASGKLVQPTLLDFLR